MTNRLPAGFHLSTVIVLECCTLFVNVEVGLFLPSTDQHDTIPTKSEDVEVRVDREYISYAQASAKGKDQNICKYEKTSLTITPSDGEDSFGGMPIENGRFEIVSD